MRKNLLTLALFIAVFSMKGYTGTAKAKQGLSGHQPTAGTAPTAPRQNDGVSLPHDTAQQNTYQVVGATAPAKDRWDRASVIIDAVLALIGIGGIVIAVITLKKLERQTTATEEAANAAYGSVTYAEAQWSLMKEKERARISIKPGRTEVQKPNSEYWNLATSIEIRNLGQSRAFIKKTGGSFAIAAEGEELPPKEDWSSLFLSDDFIDPSTTSTIVSLRWFHMESESLKTLADDLHGSQRYMHLRGFIEYETLGMTFTEEFRYFWVESNSLGEGYLVEVSTPTDAERVEKGRWWENRYSSDSDKQEEAH